MFSLLEFIFISSHISLAAILCLGEKKKSISGKVSSSRKLDYRMTKTLNSIIHSFMIISCLFVENRKLDP